MRHRVMSSSLVLSLLLGGCGSSTGAKSENHSLQVKALQGATLDLETNTIITNQDTTTLNIFGVSGDSIYINDKEVGAFSPDGEFRVTLQVQKEGSYLYKVTSKNHAGEESSPLTLEVIKHERSASLGTLETKGEPNALTASEQGVVFIAEKNHGVEIVSIGFSDRIASDLLATIEGIEAENVILSEDQTKLYVEDKEGKYHIMDISDLSHPVEIKVVDEIEKKEFVASTDGRMHYKVCSCGLKGEEVLTGDETLQKFFYKDKDILDLLLVDDDTKLLVARGAGGLELIDISDENNPTMIGRKNLGAVTSGLSLIKQDGVLFVANGQKGVEIFNLDILLDEMTP